MSPRHPAPGTAAPAPVSHPGTPQVIAAEPDMPGKRLAYSINEVVCLTGLSRDLLYDEMRRGNLPYRKVGRRRLITRHHLQQFLGLASSPEDPHQARDTSTTHPRPDTQMPADDQTACPERSVSYRARNPAERDAMFPTLDRLLWL